MDSRESMIRVMRDRYGFNDLQVINAMLQVPREHFVDIKIREFAYDDKPLDIGFGQTISQPYTVAFMTSLLNVKKTDVVLEVGTGSGYQAAVLSKMVKWVYTVEVIKKLGEKASRTLSELGFENITLAIQTGEIGWKEYAPFNSIIVTAGLDEKVPMSLLEQLVDGGVLVAPIGKDENKQMTRLTIVDKKIYKKEEFGKFNFVPFVYSDTISS